MREINFRVWDRTEAAWHYFNLRPFSNLADLAAGDYDERTLSQDTQFSDRTGQRIYEGDRLKDRSDGVSTVIFDAGIFKLTSGMSNDVSWPLAENSAQYELVGNVFDLG